MCFVPRIIVDLYSAEQTENQSSFWRKVQMEFYLHLQGAYAN